MLLSNPVLRLDLFPYPMSEVPLEHFFGAVDRVYTVNTPSSLHSLFVNDSHMQHGPAVRVIRQQHPIYIEKKQDNPVIRVSRRTTHISSDVVNGAAAFGAAVIFIPIFELIRKYTQHAAMQKIKTC